MLFRTWFVGVTRLLVKTGELAGRQTPHTAVGVRLDGRAFIVTSQVFPVRWQPNREVRGFKSLVMPGVFLTVFRLLNLEYHVVYYLPITDKI